MMLQPVNALQRGITSRQSSLQWCHMLAEQAPLLIDARLECAMPHGESECFLVHSGFCA